MRPEVALGGTDLLIHSAVIPTCLIIEVYQEKEIEFDNSRHDTHDGLSFPHQELHSEADAVQKHQPTPAAAAEQRPDMAEQMHAIGVV